MKRIIVLLMLAFLAAFAYTVGSRMAGESRALFAGMAIGVIVSLPAALLAALVATRVSTAERPQPPAHEAMMRQQPASPPPIVIVNPAQALRSSRYASYAEAVLDPPPPRTFTVLDDGTAQRE